MGTQALIIAQAAPHLKCVVQDRDGVIPNAIKVNLKSWYFCDSVLIPDIEYLSTSTIMRLTSLSQVGLSYKVNVYLLAS